MRRRSVVVVGTERGGFLHAVNHARVDVKEAPLRVRSGPAMDQLRQGCLERLSYFVRRQFVVHTSTQRLANPEKGFRNNKRTRIQHEVGRADGAADFAKYRSRAGIESFRGAAASFWSSRNLQVDTTLVFCIGTSQPIPVDPRLRTWV